MINKLFTLIIILSYSFSLNAQENISEYSIKSIGFLQERVVVKSPIGTMSIYEVGDDLDGLTAEILSISSNEIIIKKTSKNENGSIKIETFKMFRLENGETKIIPFEKPLVFKLKQQDMLLAKITQSIH